MVVRFTRGIGRNIILTVAMVAALIAVTVWATGDVTTHADATIPADTAANGPHPAFTPLSGPIVLESDNAGMPTGSMILNAPAGFQFNTAKSVTISVGGSGTLADISATDSKTGAGTATVTPDATSITVWVVKASTGTGRTSFTWTGIEVQPQNGTSLPTGAITFSGTSSSPNSTGGLPAGTVMGTLTVVNRPLKKSIT